MNNTRIKSSGFTLIESMVYIFLFSIVIGGGMIGAYQIIESTDRTEAKTILEQDSNFILRKIGASLDNADQVIVTSPTLLMIDKATNIYFKLSGTNVQIDPGSGTYIDLNSSRIKISNLTFEKTIIGGRDFIKTTFTASSLDGKISQVFSSSKYVR